MEGQAEKSSLVLDGGCLAVWWSTGPDTYAEERKLFCSPRRGGPPAWISEVPGPDQETRKPARQLKECSENWNCRLCCWPSEVTLSPGSTWGINPETETKAAAAASLSPWPGAVSTYTLLVLLSEVITQGWLSSAQACPSRVL